MCRISLTRLAKIVIIVIVKQTKLSEKSICIIGGSTNCLFQQCWVFCFKENLLKPNLSKLDRGAMLKRFKWLLAEQQDPDSNPALYKCFSLLGYNMVGYDNLELVMAKMDPCLISCLRRSLGVDGRNSTFWRGDNILETTLGLSV